MNPIVEKGLSVLRESGALYSAKCHARDGAWLVWVNGRPVGETDTRGEGYRLLAAILFAASCEPIDPAPAS